MPMISPCCCFRFEGVEDEVFEGQLAFDDEDGMPGVFELHFSEKMEPSSYLKTIFTYTPPADFNSVDTFTLTLADPYGQGTSQVQIAMAPVNDPPVAETDYVNYTDLKKSNRLQFNVLSNDHAGPDKPAVESYYLVSHTQTDYAQGLTSLGNGSFRYTPPAGFLGRILSPTLLLTKMIPHPEVRELSVSGLLKLQVFQTGHICGISGPIWKQKMAGFIMRNWLVVCGRSKGNYYVCNLDLE